MSVVKWGLIGLLLLPVAEIAAFFAVAIIVGWLWALCLFLATTVLGLAILRRCGRKDMDRLGSTFRRDGWRAIHLESPGIAPLVAAFLLIIPGFLTDALGILLFMPAARRWIVARLRAPGSHRAADRHVIDLTPKDWHQVSEKPIRHGRQRKPLK